MSECYSEPVIYNIAYIGNSCKKLENRNFLFFFKKLLTIQKPYNIICLALSDVEKINNEVWLSLVERCVRDAEAAGSNPVTSTTWQGRRDSWKSRVSVFFCV